MIKAAQRYSQVPERNIEWRQSDVVDLPFEGDIFDFAFCQQGLQFFPQKVAALKEIRRVLAPSGSLILTVWSSVSPLFAAIGDAAARYISEEASISALSGYAFRDLAVIKALVLEAGFLQIQTENVVVQRRIGPPEKSIPLEIAGNTVGAFVAKLDNQTREAMFAEIGDAVQDYLEPDGLVFPQEAHLIRASG